jgi:hypothetical protein
MDNQITVPTLNLNGTSGEELCKEYRAAYDAVNTAYKTLAKVTVHGRDFQTVDQSLYQAARKEQKTRLLALSRLKDELLAMYKGVSAQLRERARSRSHVAPPVFDDDEIDGAL